MLAWWCKIWTSILLISIVCFSANANWNNIASPHIKNFTTRDYNGQPDNFSCIEDNRGFLFIGNLWGIIEFDGKNWRNIYFPNGSSGISFAKDHKGTLYCGGRGEFGYLSPDGTGQMQYVSLTYLLPYQIDFGEIWTTHVIDSAIIFSSFEAIFILKNNTLSVIKPKTTFGKAYAVNNTLYVWESKKGLCYLKNNKLNLVQTGENFSEKEIVAILPFKEKQLLVAAENNFYLINEKSQVQAWNTNIVFKNNNDIFSASVLNDSMYIIATKTNGSIIFDNNGRVLHFFNKTNGLISNNILNNYLDSNGNIWILSRGGISKIELNNCFSYINEIHNLPGICYTSCIFDNTFYLGTSDGLFYASSESGKFKIVTSTEGIVWALKQIDSELLCGHNEGVFVIAGKKAYRIPNTQGVWCFLQPAEEKNILLAGTYRGIMILEKKNSKWAVKGYVKGFYESSRYLVQDRMEDFWVSHGNKGLFRLSLNHTFDSVLKIKTFGPNQGLHTFLNNTVYKINGEILVTNNHGLFKYNDNKEIFEPWNEVNAALGSFNTIQRVVPDSSGFWIILQNEKIIHISKTPKGFITDVTLKKFHKLLAGSFEHINPLTSNLTLIASLEGVAIFNKANFFIKKENNKTTFSAYIRNIESTRDSFISYFSPIKGTYTKTPEVSHKQNSIRFSFTSNCFEDIELTRYQCYLSGFDNGWSPWMATTQKEYTNLPPGTYKFRIRAINSYDLLSNEDSFEFTILPPWYKSNYAFLVYFAGLLLMVWGSVKFISFRFKLQQRKLEIKKEKELWDLSKKHKEEQIQKENEILKLNNEKLQIDIAHLEQKELLQKKDQQLKEEQDKIKQEQLLHEHEKHSLEISHKNKELSILAMQIAHKSELITKIRDYLVQITDKNASNDIKMLTSQLFQFIEKDIEHEKEWKEFQAQFEMVHSSFLHKLKTSYPSISPNLLKLSTYLRVKMSNKQIARLMNTTVETVIKNRYRLKERLNLAPEENLDDFIENF